MLRSIPFMGPRGESVGSQEASALPHSMPSINQSPELVNQLRPQETPQVWKPFVGLHGAEPLREVNVRQDQ